MALAEASDLVEYLAASNDTAVRYASAEVAAFCGWHVAPSVEQTFTFTRLPGRWPVETLQLPTLHLTELGDVMQDGLLDVAEIVFTEGGQVSNPSLWRGTTISITATHGYDETPDDVMAVVLALAARWQDANADGGIAERVGQVAHRVETSTPGDSSALYDSEKEKLRRYRLVVVA